MINENIPETIILAIGESCGKIMSNMVLDNAVGISTIDIDSKTKPFINEEFILQNKDEIVTIFSSTDIVFVISNNLEQSTLAVLEMAKDNGSLAIPILVDTDNYKIKYLSYSTIIINEKEGISISVLISQAIDAITKTIIGNENFDIILDFSDLKEIMSIAGISVVNTMEYTGESAAREAIESAIRVGQSIKGVKGALVYFEINPDYPMLELFDSIKIIEDAVNEDTNIIFSTSTDSSLDINYVKVSLILTGL